MKMKRFKANYVIVPLLILAVAAGMIYSASETENSKDFVNVASVDAISKYYGGFGGADEENSYRGTLKKGTVQDVKFSSELKIDEVKVKKGDKVSKGDVLFTYDTSSVIFLKDTSNNNIKKIENEIKIAKNEIEILKKLQPSENAPQDYVPEEPEVTVPEQETEPIRTADVPKMNFVYEKLVTTSSEPVSGLGTAEDPFVFFVGTDTMVSADYLKELSGDEKTTKHALFYVCDADGNPLFARGVDGSKIDKENVTDWSVSDGVGITPDGSVSFSGSSADFASFIIQAPSAPSEDPAASEIAEGFDITALEGMIGSSEANDQPQNTNESEDSDYELSLNDNYLYSREQLKNMISENEKKIESLQLKKKQAELDVRKSEKLLETGAETATLDGTVTFVAKDIYHLAESGAYVTVTSNNGMSVASYIGEFSLSDIEGDMEVKVTDLSTGNSSYGKVTSISDLPSSELSTATESFYEFVVTVEEPLELEEDNFVSIKPVETEKEEVIQIMSMFVRSEGSKSYVMVANDDNVIEKRYVKVGQSFYGMFINVTGGLSRDDRLAIPYGKTEEGKPVKDVNIDTLIYGESILG